MTAAVLDTSVLVRYLTRDDAAKADAARAVVAAAEDGSLFLPGLAVAEMGFVLLRVYRWPPASVADAIRAVVSHPAIEVADGGTWLDVAADIEAGHGLVDAYLMRVALERGTPTLVTIDEAITPLPGVSCRRP